MNKSEELYFCELPAKSNSKKKDSGTNNSKESSSQSVTEGSKAKKHGKKRKRSQSSSSSSDESVKSKKTMKRKHKKKCKRRHKKNKESRKFKLEKKDSETSVTSKLLKATEDCENSETYGPQIPDKVLLQKAQAMAPMSKEKWDEKKNTIRRIYDEETGRNRLIRGDGEVIEEIVSRQRHCEINKQATLNSGAYFQAKLSSKDLT